VPATPEVAGDLTTGEQRRVEIVRRASASVVHIADIAVRQGLFAFVRAGQGPRGAERGRRSGVGGAFFFSRATVLSVFARQQQGHAPKAARMLSCSEAAIRKWVYQRRLPAVKVGRLTRLRVKDLEALLTKGLTSLPLRS
jgi:excisionase family DNA binding protein